MVNVGKEHCSMNISTLFMWLWTDKFVAKFILQISLNILTKHFQPIIRTGWKRVINDIYFLVDYLPRILAHTYFMYSLLVSGYFLRWAWNSDARSMELREIITSTWVFDIFNKFLMFYWSKRYNWLEMLLTRQNCPIPILAIFSVISSDQILNLCTSVRAITGSCILSFKGGQTAPHWIPHTYWLWTIG